MYYIFLKCVAILNDFHDLIECLIDKVTQEIYYSCHDNSHAHCMYIPENGCILHRYFAYIEILLIILTLKY